MKMKVIGAHEMHGTSKKTGIPYDITFVTAIHPNLEVGARGWTAENIMLDAAKFPATSVLLEAEYNIDFDSRGRVVAFEQCQHK